MRCSRTTAQRLTVIEGSSVPNTWSVIRVMREVRVICKT